MAIAERELAPPTHKRRYTEDEYLAREEAAEERSEYVNGEILPMSGGTAFHGALGMYLGAAIIFALGERDCTVFSPDVKVKTPGQMYYPDLSLACGEIVYHGPGQTAITNPILVAEVISPSTEGVDRGRKMRDYFEIDTLCVYLLVSQTEPRVEVFSRRENGQRDSEVVAGIDSILSIPALSISLKLADIYRRVRM